MFHRPFKRINITKAHKDKIEARNTVSIIHSGLYCLQTSERNLWNEPFKKYIVTYDRS